MIDHASRAHARFGASSAHRWFACPGSVRLCVDLPDVPSGAALEGTRAHELLEALLVNAYREPRARVAGDNYERRAANLWRDAPQDMRDAVHVCVDHIKELVEDQPDAVVLLEHRFEIPVASAPGEVFGTNDVCVFVPSMRTLHVIDYKHGAGVFVPVEGNKQLRFYALGALASYHGGETMLRKDFEIDTVCLTIVQPRVEWADPVREEWLPVEDVLAFGKEIGDAVARCKDPEAPLVPGEAQCRFCAARTTCPARLKEVVEDAFGGVRAVEQDRPPEPAVMPAARLGELVAIKARALAFFGDLEEEAARRMRAGEDVPGLKLVEAQARRQWNSDDVRANAEALANIVSPDGACNSDVVAEFKVEEMRGFGEIEAILKRDADRKTARARLDAMAFLTTKKSSGALKVVTVADPRPSVTPGAAFDGVVLLEDKRGD